MTYIFYNDIFIQGLGFVAFGFGILAFLQKQERHLKIIQTGQCLFLLIHFILLGATGGAIAAGIAGVRNIFSLITTTKKIAPFFMSAFMVLGIWGYDTPIDILPIIGSICSTISIFYLSGIKMRLGFLFSSSLWIIHNVVVMSYGPFLMEVLISSSLLLTIFRLHKDQKQNRDHTTPQT